MSEPTNRPPDQETHEPRLINNNGRTRLGRLLTLLGQPARVPRTLIILVALSAWAMLLANNAAHAQVIEGDFYNQLWLSEPIAINGSGGPVFDGLIIARSAQGEPLSLVATEEGLFWGDSNTIGIDPDY